MATNPPLPLQTIRTAIAELTTRVNRALRTQVGDMARLHAHRDECLRLMVTVQQVSTCYCDSQYVLTTISILP